MMLNKNAAEINLIDGRLYRDAMARYAGHVQLVTTVFEGVRRGVAVTAACSVSDNPPTILVCLNHNNEKNNAFFESGIFAINSLAAHHQPLSHAFSGLEMLDMEERFAIGQWETLVTGAPVLSDALASYDCHIVKLVPHATHTIMIGEVAFMRLGERNPPLVYMDRGYHSL